jgi:hypothetical protein
MSSTTDDLLGILPPVVASGAVLGVTKAVFPSVGGNGSSSKGKSSFEEISRGEVVSKVGKSKADVLKKNPDKQFKFGDEKYMYSDGTYYIKE